MQPKI